MPSKAYYLDDKRLHIVNSPQFTPLCQLVLEPGPFMVIAKGAVQAAGIEFNISIRFRLEVIGFNETASRGTDETEFFTDPEGPPVPIGSPDRGTFSLIAAAALPFVGGAGSGEGPPPHRAVLSAMRSSGQGAGGCTNIKVAAFRLDELATTVLNP